MLGWWVYATIVGALLAPAARAGERLLWARGRMSRPVWLLALLATVVLPLGTYATGAHPITNARLAGLLGSPAGPLAAAATSLSRATSAWLPWVWAIASLALVVAAALGEASRRMRAGPRVASSVCGVRVWLSANEGPAIIGVLRPRVLLPAWIMSASHGERRLAVAHELNHLRGGDLPLLWTAYLVACAIPWNPAAWWMLHRLHRAVEIDCDRRVLAARRDPRRYAALLVRAAAMRSAHPVMSIGLLRRHSLVRQRLQHILHDGHGSGRASRLSIAAAIGCLAAITLVPPPTRVAGDALGERAGGIYRLREVPGGSREPSRIRERPAGLAPGTTPRGGTARFIPKGTIRPMPER